MRHKPEAGKRDSERKGVRIKKEDKEIISELNRLLLGNSLYLFLGNSKIIKDHVSLSEFLFIYTYIHVYVV